MKFHKGIYKVSVIALSMFLCGCSIKKESKQNLDTITEVKPQNTSDSNSTNSNDNITTEIIGMSIDNQELRFQPEDALRYVLDGNVILLSDGSRFDINGDGRFETIHITQWKEGENRADASYINESETWDLYYDIRIDDSKTVIGGPQDDSYIGVVSLDGKEIQLLIHQSGSLSGEVIGVIGIFEYEKNNLVFKENLYCDLNQFKLEDGEYKGYEYVFDTVFANINIETTNKYDGGKIIRHFSKWNDLTNKVWYSVGEGTQLTLLRDLQLREEKDSETETLVIKKGSKVQPMGIEPIDLTQLGNEIDWGLTPFNYWLCLKDVETGIIGWIYCEHSKVYQDNNSLILDEQLFKNLVLNVG
jgi:hypothetical protein